jgi:hypothetical protein
MRATIAETIMIAVKARDVGINEDACGKRNAVNATRPPIAKEKIATPYRIFGSMFAFTVPPDERYDSSSPSK